ncbi:MAG: cyclase family protein [Ilumatobacter sp.]|uniref:cyclase family protein n=1 Tax=Ilumatobacter sp. TaxID=1967498 RepID=UPI00262DEA81|nr:cyclase family protein [Ilumatobacter sp.]MDJ0771358.1 cyclase family protein [Ilumatobacter sp.]
MTLAHKSALTGGVIALVSIAGVAGATFGVTTSGSGDGAAEVSCPGGMTRLGHPFDENMSVFPFDPAIRISNDYTVAEDFFLVEDIDTGAHAGTHLDVPAHFIAGGRSLDEFTAEEFVWPAYKIDVRGMTFTDNFVEVTDILAYEEEHGEIEPGSLVILQTGAEEFFGLDGPGDSRGFAPPDPDRPELDDQALNIDDLFDFVNPGFSGAAVQWLFDERDIDGVGADAYGPDAATDDLFDATFTTLLNDGVALVAIANLDSVSVKNDVIMAPTVALTDGSGFTTDPIACHGAPGDDDSSDDDSSDDDSDD